MQVRFWYKVVCCDIPQVIQSLLAVRVLLDVWSCIVSAVFYSLTLPTPELSSLSFPVVAGTLEKTYQVVPASIVKDVLNATDKDVAEVGTSFGWEYVAADKAFTLPITDSNKPTPKSSVETISLENEHMLKVLENFSSSS